MHVIYVLLTLRKDKSVSRSEERVQLQVWMAIALRLFMRVFSVDKYSYSVRSVCRNWLSWISWGSAATFQCVADNFASTFFQILCTKNRLMFDWSILKNKRRIFFETQCSCELVLLLLGYCKVFVQLHLAFCKLDSLSVAWPVAPKHWRQAEAVIFAWISSKCICLFVVQLV